MTNGPERISEPVWLCEFARYANSASVDWIGPRDPRYEQARLLYNRFHNLTPGAIVRSTNSTVIAQVLVFASDHALPVAIRGGGHHIAGYGSCNDGVVIDFSSFRAVQIETATGVVEVEPGARLGDVDRVLTEQGLVVPTGTVSDTGIAGLALGGGIGWLLGRYGLTCDHLIGANVVLADGREIRAEDPEHTELLWALRGGGGNFGVVTRFRFRALSLPKLIVGSATIPFQRAAEALGDTVEFLADCPRDLTIAPTFYRTSSGEPFFSIDFCLAGDDERSLGRLQQVVGRAHWSICRDADYVAWQRNFDDLFQPPMRGYWKSRYGTSLTRSDIEILLDAFSCAPTQRSAILIEHLHGAFTDGGAETSSFPLRWASFGILLSARWPDPSQDDAAIKWVQETFSRLDPQSVSPAYSNYTANDDHRAVRAFDKMAGRLAAIKSRYDPSNLFFRNHNLKPANRKAWEPNS
jgi:hypothetical protein